MDKRLARIRKILVANDIAADMVEEYISGVIDTGEDVAYDTMTDAQIMDDYHLFLTYSSDAAISNRNKS